MPNSGLRLASRIRPDWPFLSSPGALHQSLSLAAQRGRTRPVDNLLIKFALLAASQRPEIKHWRGSPRGPFGYNEGPTSSCHTFCWKARHLFDVPFFCLRTGHCAPSLRRAKLAYDATALPLRSRGEPAMSRLHGPHPQLLDHCPHRPRQEHAGRSDHPALRRLERSRDGRAGARLDGPRARARHHHQGADGGAAVHRARWRRSTT